VLSATLGAALITSIITGLAPALRTPYHDLVAALREGEIARAALDVFVDEPLPAEHPLWDLDGIIVSPHMSGDILGWRDELEALFVDNLARFRSGEPLLNVVDKTLGFVTSGGTR
jgi:phosphoglycerate dehydrogenase-like enzyme